jgi:uncharacterized phage protein gp47/JayE
MPYARPTLTALRNSAVQDVTTSGVPGLDGLLRNAVLRVLSWVMAGLAYSLYGYLDWISLEAVPFTATDEFLTAWAALVGIYQLDATAARGVAQFTGSPGIPIPQGTALTRQDGTPYLSTADSGTDPITGVALVPMIAAVTGAITNCDPGTPIAPATPIVGLNSNGVTVGYTDGGADQETPDAFRSRMLARYAAPPHGGDAADYVEWATSVPGCTRAWINPQGYGPGSVVVYPMFDVTRESSGGFPQGTDGCAVEETRGPSAAGDQALVADYLWTVQPVTSLVYVAAPRPLPTDVALLGLDPNTPEQQAAILASLQDMFQFTASVAGVIYPSDIYQAILSTPGVEHFSVAAPALPVVAGTGQLPVMGVLTAT